MQIGMFYQMQVPRPSSRSYEADRFLEMLDQVAYAEEMGLSSVWMADHQFRTEWSHSSAPDVTLGALSQRTSRMRLGIAVVVPPVQHPLHIAARTATLDILSKGRVDLGVGRSGYPYQMAAFGTDLKDATGMVEEALESSRRHGPRESSPTKATTTRFPARGPPQAGPAAPPAHLARLQPGRHVQEGGTHGLGLPGNGRRRGYRIGSSRASLPGGIRNANPTTGVVHNRVSVSTVAICGESRKYVQERSAEYIDWYRHQQALRDVRVWSEQDASRVPEDYQWHYTRSTATDSPKREEASSLDQIRSGRYCIGDPDDCIRYLEAYAEAGVDEVMPLFQVGGISHEEVMDTLRLFGKYVIPHFNAKGS